MHTEIEKLFAAFRSTVAIGADMELRLRMLADKTPAIERFSTAKDMGTVEKAIIDHFGHQVTGSERTILRVARQLRNKLMHGDFTSAVAKLEELGYEKQPPAIKVLKVPEKLTVAGLLDALAGAQPFAVDDAPNSGHLVAWHLQLCADGSLVKAAEVFRKGVAIIDRLAMA